MNAEWVREMLFCDIPVLTKLSSETNQIEIFLRQRPVQVSDNKSGVCEYLVWISAESNL